MLRVNTEFRKGVLFVRLSGNVSSTNNLDEIRDVINNFGIKYVVFNLNNLRFIDFDSINYIIDYNKFILKNNGHLLICDKNINRLRIFNNIVPNINCEIEAFSLI